MKRYKAHSNTWKLNRNFSMITDVLLDQKRVDVREHMIKMAPCDNSRNCHVALSLPCVHIHLLSSD